jgi:8-oxo-dGTP pyrophosphatase MutT (NUDIX family)
MGECQLREPSGPARGDSVGFLPVRREFSAGGVVVLRKGDGWQMAAIRPGGRPEGLWALPKGQIDPGETGEDTAVREVAEETGVQARSLGKLGDVRYWFNWEGERVFKVVSFFLLVYESGELGAIPEAFRHEVEEARWLPLEEAPKLLAYRGERDMAVQALTRLTENEDV